MPTGLTGRHSGTAYIGVEAPQPPNMLSFPRNPTTTDFQNYFTGDLWLNNNRTDAANFQSLWYYASQLGNVATWIRLSTGSGNLQTLTGDAGGPVFPLANNINVNGLNGIVTTGNIAPASPHQLTIGSSSGHTFMQSVEGDDLVKVFADATGNINTRGGLFLPNVLANIETFGNVGTFTEFFALKNSINQPPTTADGTSGVYSLGTSGSYVTDRFLHNYGTNNTFVGYQAGNMTLTTASATDNTAIGSSGPLSFITTGQRNTVTGSTAALNLLTGNNNCIYGFNSGFKYSGAESGNIIVGANAAGQTGENNIIRIVTPADTGDQNIFIGQGALGALAVVGTAKTNICIGADSGQMISTAVQNVGVGPGVFSQLSSGSANTALGQGAMQGITTALHNTAIGFGSMLNATDLTNLANVALGLQSLEFGTKLVQNTALGVQALFNVGQGGSTATGNVAVGYTTGINYTTSESYNVILGYNNRGVIGESNVMRLGTKNGGPEDTAKCFVFGVRGVTTGNADAIAVLVDSAGQFGTASSSIKYKTNIRPLGDDSEDIFNLTPVKFNWIDDEDGPDHWGLIAEEVENIMPGLVAHNDKGEPFSVKYHELPVLLLNEIKKLKKDIELLKSKLM